MKKKSKRAVFAVCINNTGYPASLEAGKLYEIVPDEEAKKHGLIRVIDESGEDYGYSAERFFVLDLPPALETALKHTRAATQHGATLKRSSRTRASSVRLSSKAGARGKMH